MNKKSNIIVGIVVIALIGVSALGFSLTQKPGKGTEPAKAAQTQQAAKTEQPEGGSGVENGSSTSNGGSFVASKSGTKYFPVDCGSSKTIKEENKVFFSSASAAETAGYELAKNCK